MPCLLNIIYSWSDRDPSESNASESGEDIALDINRTRKRVRNEQAWAKNKCKKLRNAWKSYVNIKGAVKCFKNVSSSDRSQVLEEFNNLQSFDIQNAYIHGLIKRSEPTCTCKRRYTSKGSNSKRKNCFSKLPY